MTQVETDVTAVHEAAPPSRRGPSRGTLVLVVVVVAVASVAAAVIAYETGIVGGGGSNAGSADNTSATSVTRIVRRSLSQQTQVSATLGYAAPSTIVVPAGTSTSSLQQAEQAVTTAQGQLQTAQAALASDGPALDQARATLAASRAKQAVDCRGSNAAESPAASSGAGGGGSGSTPCANDQQVVTTAEQTATQAAAKVAADQSQVSSAQKALASAQSALSEDQVSGAVYGQSSTYTSLPAIGQIVVRGHSLYAISGQPVILLYGPVAAWRAFIPGMTPGRDVAELNANLDALGYGHGLSGNSFTAATAAAIEAFQGAHGSDRTGQLLLGSVVFEPGAVRVTAVTPTLGATVQPGPVLSITSTARQVTIALDAAQQSDVKVGDPVLITLPDNSTTPGRVSYVGTVATTPSSDQGGGGGGGGGSSPTIEVDVTPTHPAATGHLDQAPVNVSITTASVRDALVVPVNALLALAGGGYALEEVGAGGVHHLVAVELGLFDDQEGVVQVTGSGLAAGQRVVVPAS